MNTILKLNYSFEALEPFIDAKTMEIHYSKHYQAYFDNMTAIIGKYPQLSNKSAKELIRDFDNLSLDEKDKAAFRNNAGGFLNHNLYWQIMAPQKEIDEGLRDEIIKEFGSTDEFKKYLKQTAISRFGSGWAWLVKNDSGKLQVYSTANQDSPLMKNHEPLIGVDVWEHAYYLKYQNKRADYIDNWFNVLKLI